MDCILPLQAFRRVKFQGLPSVSSRSSSSYSTRSGLSLQSSQSITEREFSQVQLNSMMARLTPTWHAVLQRMDKVCIYTIGWMQKGSICFLIQQHLEERYPFPTHELFYCKYL